MDPDPGVVTQDRYNRNELLFGAEGQARITATHTAVVGIGGLGAHVVQQLAYLGVKRFTLVDGDRVEETNLNRLVGATAADAGTSKVSVAQRVITSLDATAEVRGYEEMIQNEDAKSAVAAADVVFGCLDRDLARLELTEVAARAALPYFDLASDSGNSGGLWYGGRIVFSNGQGCLSCLHLLDQEEMTRDSLAPDQRAAHDATYGVDSQTRDRPGPSVVSVNGVVASLAVTSFIEFVTGIRVPAQHLIYLGHERLLRRSVDEPDPDCFYCELWRNR
jgi:molybdopterin/thiamine biosynthesis adenylyltransferase